MNLLSLMLMHRARTWVENRRATNRLAVENLEDRFALSAMGLALPPMEGSNLALRPEATTDAAMSMEQRRSASRTSIPEKLRAEAVDEVMSMQGFLIDTR